MYSDGRRAVLRGPDNTLQVWDLEAAVCLRTLELDIHVGCISVTADECCITLVLAGAWAICSSSCWREAISRLREA